MLPVWLSDIRGALLAFLVTELLAFFRCFGLSESPVLRCGLALSCLAGLCCSISFYLHTCRAVFNRKPTLSFKAFWHHFMVTRPLEVVWRFLTAPFRVQPDFHILGETRTGTTSMAAHLRGLGCIGPFSPWIIPLASDKESFYFVGHYWGLVHPGAYRMCFPLEPTMWLYELWYGERPPVFDACASHLNAPWAAPLIRAASPEAALLVMLRPPAEQNASWWRLEQGAHAWARGMGLEEDFLREGYPPRSFQDALRASQSEPVAELYRTGELAAAKVLGAFGTSIHGVRGLIAALRAPCLSELLLPFPGGQLCAFEHMGRYARNVARYAKLFGKERMVFAETQAELGKPGGAALISARLSALVPRLRRWQDRPVSRSLDGRSLSAGGQSSDNGKTALRLNESQTLPPELEPPQEVLAQLRQHYRAANLELFEFLGRDLGWNDESK
ncbi:unnamed protein product [Polarella glacialis]|uniref:Sulfotransferase n=1 Tax=Polarella glacialis TaxID=89957 RepID=A0A813FAS3_POLGL|nr:unnamed protein product [Polarella glacialis]